MIFPIRFAFRWLFFMILRMFLFVESQMTRGVKLEIFRRLCFFRRLFAAFIFILGDRVACNVNKDTTE